MELNGARPPISNILFAMTRPYPDLKPLDNRQLFREKMGTQMTVYVTSNARSAWAAAPPCSGFERLVEHSGTFLVNFWICHYEEFFSNKRRGQKVRQIASKTEEDFGPNPNIGTRTPNHLDICL